VWRATYRGLVAMALLPSCLASLTFECEDDAACVFDDVDGQCIAPGHCAYAQAECASGLRFGPAAGPGLASTCVDPTSGATGSGSDTDACGPCDAVTRECHAAEASCVAGACTEIPAPSGSACRQEDPCVVTARCDGAGTCVVEVAVECLAPPTPCSVAPGVCGADGTCVYARRDAGMPCEDGDGCTLGDQCDGDAACVPGTVCPTDNPCAVGSCTQEQCSFFPVVDGTACGMTAGESCCAGACVDLTKDVEHCGACDGVCTPPDGCVAMGTTGACMPP
jgi:hypothetical protein